MSKIRIDKNQPLNVGDRVELHFRSTGMMWVKSTQIALIEYRLKKRKDFRIRSIYCPDLDPTKLIITVEVINPEPTEPELQTAGAGVVITCVAIAGVIIVAGVVYELCLEDTFLLLLETMKTGTETVKEVVTSPEGKAALTGASIALPLIAGIVLFKLLK